MRIRVVGLVGMLTASMWMLGACGSASPEPPTGTPTDPPPPPPPPTGSLAVQIGTQGVEPDADGYLVSVDGANPVSAGTNGEVTFQNLGVGDHQVLVTGIDCNCALVSDNPRTVAVSAGQTLNISLTLACTARSAEPTATYLPEPVFNGVTEFASRGSQILIASARRRGQPISSGQQPSGPMRWMVKNFDSSLPVRSRIYSDPVQFLQQPYSIVIEADGTARVMLDRFTQASRNSEQSISLQIAGIGNAFDATPTDPVFDVLVPADDAGLAHGLQLAPGLMAVYQNVLSSTDLTSFTSRRSGVTGVPNVNPVDSTPTRRHYAIAASGTGYLLASLDYSSFAFGRVEVQPLMPTGASAGARTIIDASANSQLSPTPPAITWCGDRYAMVWWGQLPYGANNTTHAQLRATTLDANGMPLQSTVNLTGDLDVTAEFELKQPALICEGGVSLAVAYAPSSGTLEFLRLDPSLATLASRTLNAPDRMQVGTRPRLFADATSYVAGWIQGQGTLGFSRFCRN
jgi:hypothetical protein